MTVPLDDDDCDLFFVQNCYKRSEIFLGTTDDDSDSFDDDDLRVSYFSESEEINPAFWNWTKVYVRYCDGGSFSGLRTEPIEVDNKSLYFQGNYILQAVMNELYQGVLSNATHAVVSGDSSGGLAVYLHSHQFVSNSSLCQIPASFAIGTRPNHRAVPTPFRK